MELIHEGVLQYNGSERRPPAHCYVRIYLPESVLQQSAAEKHLAEHYGIIERPLIVACEMSDNKGMSVTNKIELVATIAWREHLPSPERWNAEGPIVITHYPGKPVPPERKTRRHLEEESFDRATMEVIDHPYTYDQRYYHLNYARWLAHALWSYCSRDELEKLLGQPFPPFPLTRDEVSA